MFEFLTIVGEQLAGRVLAHQQPIAVVDHRVDLKTDLRVRFENGFPLIALEGVDSPGIGRGQPLGL